MTTKSESQAIEAAMKAATRGRTQNQTVAPAAAELLPAVAKGMETAQDQLAQTDQVMDEVLAAGIDLGRLEALDFVAVTANTAILSIYENVKKSKAWRFLRNPKDGRNGQFESLEEFCEIKLGKSYKRLRTLAAQKSLIGQEAYEQAERLGLRDVDYNAIKALPAPDQELVRRAVEEAQSRDEVLDLLQELAARHAKEKEALTQQAAEAKAEAEAKEQRLKVVRDRLEQAEQKADLFQALPPDEQLKEIQAKATNVVDTVLGHINGSFRAAVMAITQHDDVDRTPTATGWLLQIQAALDELRDLYNLRPQAADGVPEWERWAQQQDALKSTPRAN